MVMRPENIRAALLRLGAQGATLEQWARGRFRRSQMGAAARWLASLVSAGLVTRTGRGRHAVYRVTGKGERFIADFGKPVEQAQAAEDERPYDPPNVWAVGHSLPTALEPGLYGPDDAPEAE